MFFVMFPCHQATKALVEKASASCNGRVPDQVEASMFFSFLCHQATKALVASQVEACVVFCVMYFPGRKRLLRRARR